MGKGGIVFYFWEADATEKGSLGPNTVVNSNQKKNQGGCMGGEMGGVGLFEILYPSDKVRDMT